MKFLKRLVLFLAIFVSTFASIECSAVEKDQIIIGTWQVKRNEAYNYVCRALNKGFTKIDMAQDYGSEEEVGKAISDYEKSAGKRVYVITKFKLDPADNDYQNAILNKFLDSQKKLGHVDEFLLHDIINVNLENLLEAFKKLKDEGYLPKELKLGISNFSQWDFAGLSSDSKNIFKKYVQVIQNPYWYGADNVLNVYGFGIDFAEKIKELGITYETYKTLGHGELVKKGFLSSFLVQHSINQGFVPIVKASTDEHLDELIIPSDISLENQLDDSFHIGILCDGQ